MIETGFSDFHHLIYTILKSRFTKLPPKTIRYRDYKKYSESQFLTELSFNLAKESPGSIESFTELFDKTLDKYAPFKTVVIRGNNKPHMSKTLRKAIMLRTRLKNRSVKTRNEADLRRYRQQRNLVVKLNKRAKREYYENLDMNSINDNKSFWKKLKPLFSNSMVNEKIVLIENDKIIRDDKDISQYFNEYFANITDTLNIPKFPDPPVKITGDPVLDAIQKYASHPSVLKIKAMALNNGRFEFSSVDPTLVFSEISKMDPSKKTSGAIPTDKLKLASSACYKEITYHINKAICTNVFPDILKLADVSPIFKMGETFIRGNYRPISVLSSLSKLYERVLSQQIVPFMVPNFSNLLCAFRENHSSQHALLRLIELCRKGLDKKGIVGMVLMDLSKAFDCLPHDLLIAKLEAYGFGIGSLRLIFDYLTSRKQRVRINSTYSSWLEITSGVPQGSVLGPLLFNIYINDLTFFIEDSHLCNFADDNTLYASDFKLERVISRLENDMHKTLVWFESNMMVANPSKFQFMFMGLGHDYKLCMEIDEKVITTVQQVKLLGVVIDSKLKFDDHVKSLCLKANRNVSALSRAAKLIDPPKCKLLYNSFVMSNFRYCPLIWMFCGKTANKEINRVHKRALRILLKDYDASFEELLIRNDEKTVHVQNLQKLLIEVYKSLNHENPSFLWDLFTRKEINYNLRVKDILTLPKASTASFGTNSIAYRGSILWNSTPDVIKSSSTVTVFGKNIKNWFGEGCSCKICKT